MRPISAGAIGLAAGIVVGGAGSQRWGGDIAAYVGSMPQPVATVIAAAVAAGVVAWQARNALHHIIAGQNHRAQLEADARADQARIAAEGRADQAKHDLELRQADRDAERKALAAALHGELMALMDSVHRVNDNLGIQSLMWEAVAKDRSLDFPAIELNFVPVYRVPLYEANIPRLGLLGPAVAGDVTMTFSRAMAPAPPKSDAKLNPEMAAKLMRAILESQTDWTWDMVHVSKRLSHIHFGNPDPGFLSDDRARRKKEKGEK